MAVRDCITKDSSHGYCLDMRLDGHTPGPWKVSSGSPQLVGCDGFWIASTMGIKGPEGEANARLIAAAPEFAEAAPAAVEILDRYASFIRDWVKAEDLEMHPYLPQIELVADYLRETIAKAKAPSRA